MSSYTTECLRKISFFENLDTKELELLKSFTKKRVFREGEVLFYEKDNPKHLTLLAEGTLKIFKTDPKGNEVVLHRFTPYSLVAEMAVLEGIPYPATAQFLSDGSVVEIDFEKFKMKFLSNPDVALNFFKSLSHKIKHLENVIAFNLVLDSTSRVAKYIYEHEGKLPIKHNQLAQYLHMTPETLSRMLKKLIKLGLIEKKDTNEFIITNKESLKVLFE